MHRAQAKGSNRPTLEIIHITISDKPPIAPAIGVVIDHIVVLRKQVIEVFLFCGSIVGRDKRLHFIIRNPVVRRRWR